MNRAKLLTFVGYPTFFFFALVSFGYATFPFERLARNIISDVERNFGVVIEFEGFEPSWGTGITVDNLTVSVPAARKTDPPAVYEISNLEARAGLFALLGRRLALDLSGEVAGGEVEASYHESPEEASLEIEVTGVQLANIQAFQALTGMPVSGGIAGTLDITLPEKKVSKARGSVELTIIDGEVGAAGAIIKKGLTGHLAYLAEEGIKMEKAISLGRFRVAFDVKDGRASASEFIAEGGDALGEFNGSIALRDRVSLSTLGGYVQFKISEEYLRDSRKFSLLMGSRELTRAKRTDGFFGFKVAGTLGNPRFMPARSDVKAPGVAGAGVGPAAGAARPTAIKPGVVARPGAGAVKGVPADAVRPGDEDPIPRPGVGVSPRPALPSASDLRPLGVDSRAVPTTGDGYEDEEATDEEAIEDEGDEGATDEEGNDEVEYEE